MGQFEQTAITKKQQDYGEQQDEYGDYGEEDLYNNPLAGSALGSALMSNP